MSSRPSPVNALVTATGVPIATASSSARRSSTVGAMSALVRSKTGTAPLCHAMVRYRSMRRALTSWADATTKATSTLAASTCSLVSTHATLREKTVLRSTMPWIVETGSRWCTGTQSPTAGREPPSLRRWREATARRRPSASCTRYSAPKSAITRAQTNPAPPCAKGAKRSWNHESQPNAASWLVDSINSETSGTTGERYRSARPEVLCSLLPIALPTRGEVGGAREKLRRRPTAVKRSLQAQPFERHLLCYSCEDSITVIANLSPSPWPSLLRGDVPPQGAGPGEASSRRTPLPRGRGVLCAFEVRLPLLREGFDALLGILRDENPADRFSLESQAETERRAKALGHGELGVADGDARAGRQLGGIIDGTRAARGGVGEEPVNQAELFGFGWVQGRGVGDEIDALGKSDQTRQPLRTTGAGKQAEVHLREADLVRTLGRKT